MSRGRYALVSSGRVRHPLDSMKFFTPAGFHLDSMKPLGILPRGVSSGCAYIFFRPPLVRPPLDRHPLETPLGILHGIQVESGCRSSGGRYALVSSGRVRHPLDSKRRFVRRVVSISQVHRAFVYSDCLFRLVCPWCGPSSLYIIFRKRAL